MCIFRFYLEHKNLNTDDNELVKNQKLFSEITNTTSYIIIVMDKLFFITTTLKLRIYNKRVSRRTPFFVIMTGVTLFNL